MSDGKNSTATATTATADTQPGYRGRFAPSPSGDLHWGSLYTAAASYLDARASGGCWLVRIEDLDLPRVVAGSATSILTMLEAFGFEWDEDVVYQSTRGDRYAAALDRLGGSTFECSCSRTQLAEDDRYPGNCRNGPCVPSSPTATRVRIDSGYIQFTDRIQGIFRQDVGASVGDVVLRRRDGLVAYALAVVVDDAAQGITHVVRGADLLDAVPRQIHLQRMLGLPSPSYAHVPILTAANGKKLAKSERSIGINGADPRPQLVTVLRLLGLAPPAYIRDAMIAEIWTWAIAHWRLGAVPKRLTHPFDS